MQCNVGDADRKIRGVLAIILVVLAFWTRWSLWWLFLVVAAMLMVTVFTRQCLLYSLFHHSTMDASLKKASKK